MPAHPNLELDKTIAFHEGLFGVEGFFTDNVRGVVNRVGNFLFYCNFPKAPSNPEWLLGTSSIGRKSTVEVWPMLRKVTHQPFPTTPVCLV